MVDLFRTKKEALREWILKREYTRTSEVIAYGQKHFYNRALRTVQQIAEAGELRRLTDREREIGGFGATNEGVWTNRVDAKAV